ncbi:class I SAM-dependent methyltransferase [Candidatus Nomurabacteria bacterium]|nr:class I SAM-dependent methyltransferase [Candidatus Nomurabacteria bacterium]
MRRRVGLNTVVDVQPGAAGQRMIDIGCGIGRNLAFGTEMGLEMYGNDLSAEAVKVAREFLAQKNNQDWSNRVVEASILSLPWESDYFDHAISDSVLDSMPFEVAQGGIAEIARLVRRGGYFYFNVISGDQTGHDFGYCDETVVTLDHEKNTIQSYFNRTKIDSLIEPYFEILSCQLHQVNDHINGKHFGRWHVISRRRQL